MKLLGGSIVNFNFAPLYYPCEAQYHLIDDEGNFLWKYVVPLLNRNAIKDTLHQAF
jgi:hypothetical protein